MQHAAVEYTRSRLESGEEVWHTPHPGCGDNVPGCGPRAIGRCHGNPGVVFSAGLDGHLRGYSADDGRIIWDVDTKGEHRTVNGVAAHGGSIDGPGVVVVGGSALCDLRIRRLGRRAGERAARLLGGRPLSHIAMFGGRGDCAPPRASAR